MDHEIPLVFARSKRLRVEYIKYVQSQVDKILSNHALRVDKFVTCILNQGNLIDQNFCDCDKKKILAFLHTFWLLYRFLLLNDKNK